ncbi:MAG: hypothetical protein NTW15_17975 [Burkholderiales bacterium]|nr:hypothetical protein [Burkholderiales bacterium]
MSEIAPPDAIQLSFRVRIVRTEEHLTKAVQIRASSYGRHHPEVAELLQSPEDADRAAFALILLAESKVDGSALGTMRIETNTHGPLPIEGLLPSDSPYAAQTMAFVTRLAVRAGADATLVKLAIFKALHRYCLACQIDWIIVTARPPMDRQYLRLGFVDVYDSDTLLPISWSENIPMRLMALETISCEREWRRIGHPLYAFMFNDYTPDIEIFNSVSGVWARPRNRIANVPDEAQIDQMLGIPLV